MRNYIFILTAIFLLQSTACSRKEITPDGQANKISFVATLEGGVESKATLHPSGPLSGDVSLGLIACKYAGDNATTGWSLLSSPAAVKAEYDSRAGSVTSGKWIPIPSHRLKWPGSGYVRFFAYAPYEAGVTVNVMYPIPRLSYTVPEPSQQVDLLVNNAESAKQYDGDPGWRNIDVAMTMTHALTGIRFRVQEGVEIASVRLTGVNNSGILTIFEGLSWQGISGNAAYEFTGLSLGAGLHEDTANPGFNILDDDKILFLMPQTLPAGARIEAVVSRYGLPSTVIEAVIGKSVWKIGEMLTYTIALDPHPHITEGYSVHRPDIWK